MKRQVTEFLADLESQPSYSESTRLAYDNDLRCFVEYLEGELNRPAQLSDFKAQYIADFLHHERRLGRRPSTLLRRRASLKRFARFIGQQDPDWALSFQQEANVIDEAISVPSPLQKPHYLIEEQIESLWKVLEASPSPRARRDQAILALLLESGLTVGSLIQLNLSDVDKEAGKLRLHTTEGQEFWLPLGDATQPMCRYLDEGRPELVARPDEGSLELNHVVDEPALFISQIGGRMSRQGVWQVLRQWGNRAGLPVTLSPRLARHTAAYRLRQNGRSLPEIQTLLGHNNPLSTRALLRRLFAEEG